MIMIPLMKSTFYKEKETRAALAEFILQDNYLSMGEQCFEFERQFAKTQNRKHAVLFNSGGSANLALIQALKNLGWIKDNDKIGVSAVTWSTDIMPIIQLGMQPVLVDVQPNTLNISSYTLADAIKKHGPFSAVFVTNALGFCGDLNIIRKMCRDYGMLLLEDNCESLGTETQYGQAGSFGLAATYSFYVAHHLSTIEGGMVCTNSDALEDMLCIVRSNGWDRNVSSDTQRYLRTKHAITPFFGNYTFYDLGYNFKPTEITGYLGLFQLQYLPEIIQIREKLFKRFNSVIESNNDFRPVRFTTLETISAFANPVICQCESLRDEYLKRFHDAGVETRPIISGNSGRQPFYAKYCGTQKLMGANGIHNCGFYFGNCPDYTEEEIEIILGCLYGATS